MVYHESLGWFVGSYIYIYIYIYICMHTEWYIMFFWGLGSGKDHVEPMGLHTARVDSREDLCAPWAAAFNKAALANLVGQVRSAGCRVGLGVFIIGVLIWWLPAIP